MGLCLLLLTEHLVSNGPGWRLPVVCLCPDLAPIISSVLGLSRKFRKGLLLISARRMDYSIILICNGFISYRIFYKSIGYVCVSAWGHEWSSPWWSGHYWDLSWCWWQQANDTEQLISAVSCHSPPFLLLIGQCLWEPRPLIGCDQDWLLPPWQGQGSDQEPWERRQRKQQFTIYRWKEEHFLFLLFSLLPNLSAA